MKKLFALAAIVSTLVACGDDDVGGGSSLHVTAIELTPSAVVHALDAVHIRVTTEKADGATLFVDFGEEQMPTGGGANQTTLTATGDVYEGDLVLGGQTPGLHWLLLSFDNTVLYERTSTTDATYTRTDFSSGCKPCEAPTELAVAEVTSYTAAELLVDNSQAGAYDVDAGSSLLFYFDATTTGEHTVTVAPESGNADLGVCSGLPCTLDSVDTTDIGTSFNGDALVDRVTHTMQAGTRYFVVVTGITSGRSAIRVQTGAGSEVLAIGSARVAETLNAGESVTYGFVPDTTTPHTVFVYNRSETTALWTIGQGGSNTTFFSGNIMHRAAGATIGQEYAITLSHDGMSAIDFDILVVSGDGSVSQQLASGDNTFGFTPQVSPQVVSFAALGDATHTVTATSADATLNFDLFSDSGLSTPVTWGAGTTLCAYSSSNSNTQCTTTNALSIGTIYYLRLTPTSLGESYGELTLNVASP